MRLIDGDDLLVALKRKEPISDRLRFMWAECLQEVRFAPTIEPETEEEAYERGYTAGQMAQRKKGKWRRRLVDCGFNADWHCSRCGWKTSLEEHGYNFCPNCGAKMEGCEQDGTD